MCRGRRERESKSKRVRKKQERWTRGYSLHMPPPSLLSLSPSLPLSLPPHQLSPPMHTHTPSLSPPALSSLSLVDCEGLDHLFSPLSLHPGSPLAPLPHRLEEREPQKPSELGPKAFVLGLTASTPRPQRRPHRHPLQTGRAMLVGRRSRGGEPKSIAHPLLSSPLPSSPLQTGRARARGREREKEDACDEQRAAPPPPPPRRAEEEGGSCCQRTFSFNC